MLKVPAGFARLLATENIGVRLDSTASTAYFDTTSRTLALPNWDCSDRLRDMLIGHEVAHAIFTDPSPIVDLVTNRVGAPFEIAKGYLNVVEDARIDRLIQRRYAGLRRDYLAGYREMQEKDFFGLAGRDIATLPLIDRINLHFKHVAGVPFTAEEQVFVDRIATLETFDEVCEVAKELFERSGAEQEEQQEEGDMSTMPSPDVEEDEEDGDDAESPAGEDGDDTAGDGSGADSEQEEKQEQGRATAGGGAGKGQPAASITDDAMSRAQEQLVNREEFGDREPSHFELPRLRDINLDSIIYTYANILRDSREEGFERGGTAKFDEFCLTHRATLTNMVQQFDRRKAAAMLRRAAVSKTGRLDLNALPKYRFTEDIFLRGTVFPKGKNHGMILYVDWSGSMSVCFEETIKQTLLLALFCKRIGIPFRVYGFTTWRPAPEGLDQYAVEESQFYPTRGIPTNINLGNFTLLEIFSSEMSKSDLAKMATLLIDCGEVKHYNGPKCLWLSGTPLNECIVAGFKIADNFKNQYKIEILNSIWITDGQDNSPWGWSWSRSTQGSTVADRDTGKIYSLDGVANDSGHQDRLLKMYKDKVGGNLLGIYLDDPRRIRGTIYYSMNDSKSTADRERLVAKFKAERFILWNHGGYDQYFLMDRSVMVTSGSDNMDAVDASSTHTRVINAFRKDMSNRGMSRPLLNTFIESIAKELVA